MQNLRMRNRHGDLPSDVEEILRKKSAHLERKFEALHEMDILLDVPHRSQRKGNETVVKLTARVPGHKPIVVHGTDKQVLAQGQNVYFAIDQAFEALDHTLLRIKEKPLHERTDEHLTAEVL